MTLVDSKTPYEILIRFGYDGLPRGAHAQYLRRVILDGELLKEEIGDAQPLDLEGFPTSAIMSDVARDALAEVTRLNGQVAALSAEVARQVALVASAEVTIAALRLRIGELTGPVDV